MWNSHDNTRQSSTNITRLKEFSPKLATENLKEFSMISIQRFKEFKGILKI